MATAMTSRQPASPPRMNDAAMILARCDEGRPLRGGGAPDAALAHRGMGKALTIFKKMGKKMDFEVHPIGTAKKMGHCPTEVMTAAQVRFRRTEGWLMWKNGWPEKKSEKPRRVL